MKDRPLKHLLAKLLRRSERYVKTDTVYLIRSGFWSNLGTITVSLGSLVLYIVFSHFVSKEDYGTYQYLLSVGAIIGAFTLTGMNSAVTRAVAQGYEGALRQSVQIQMKWNIVPLLGSWVLGGYYLFHHNLTLGWGLVLIGIFVPINNTLNTYTALLGGKKDFRRAFLFGLWWNIPYYIAVSVAAYYFKAALILLAANLITQCIGLFVAYRHTLRAYTPNKQTDPGAMRFGNHLSVMGLFGSIANQADNILVFHFLGPAQLALYSFATAIPSRIGSLFKFIPNAALPKFAERTPAEIRVGFARRLALGTLVSIFFALGYILVARFIFTIFFPAYLAAVPYSLLYAFSLASLMSGVVMTALTAAGNMRSLYIYNVVSPLLLLGMQFSGIIFFGLWGLIAGRVLAEFLLFLFLCVLYWRIN